jgi:hypothetical protein
MGAPRFYPTAPDLLAREAAASDDPAHQTTLTPIGVSSRRPPPNEALDYLGPIN